MPPLNGRPRRRRKSGSRRAPAEPVLLSPETSLRQQVDVVVPGRGDRSSTLGRPVIVEDGRRPVVRPLALLNGSAGPKALRRFISCIGDRDDDSIDGLAAANCIPLPTCSAPAIDVPWRWRS